MPEEQRAKDGAAVAATAQRSDLPRSVTDRSKKCLAERFQGFLNSNLIIKNSKNLNWKKSKKYKFNAFFEAECELSFRSRDMLRLGTPGLPYRRRRRKRVARGQAGEQSLRNGRRSRCRRLALDSRVALQPAGYCIPPRERKGERY